MTNKTFMISLLMLLVTSCIIGAVYSRPQPVVIQTNLEKLPMVIGEYTATEDSFPEEVYRELNADKNIYRHYRSRSGDQIDLYIGYYGTAKGGRTGHNPYACLPSEGEAIVDTGSVYLKQNVTEKDVPVKYILASKDAVNTIMLHWYQSAGKIVISTGIRQNIERFVGRLLCNRNDGAFVRLSAPALKENVPKTKEELEQFAATLMNLLPTYWPIER